MHIYRFRNSNWTSLNVCGSWLQWPCNLCKHYRKSIYIQAHWKYFFTSYRIHLHEQSAMISLAPIFLSIIYSFWSNFKSKAFYNRKIDVIIKMSISHSWGFLTDSCFEETTESMCKNMPSHKTPTLLQLVGRGLSLYSHAARLDCKDFWWLLFSNICNTFCHPSQKCIIFLDM